MGIIKQITEAEYREVRVGPPGHEYHAILARIRRVRSADLLARGGGALLATLPAGGSGEDAEARLRAEVARVPERAAAMMQVAYATVAAGLAQTSRDDGATWEGEDLTMDEAGRMPDAVVSHLCGEIMAFSQGRGEVARALASFPAADAGAAGHAGPEVQHGPGGGAGVEPRKARRGHARAGGRDDGGGAARP